jgi:hypothetical protein
MTKVRIPFLFSRDKKFKRKPKHFKFDTTDIYLSDRTPQKDYRLPHWRKYPKTSTRIITGKELIIQLQINMIIKRWRKFL